MWKPKKKQVDESVEESELPDEIKVVQDPSTQLEEEVEEEKNLTWSIQEVPTQTSMVIFNSKTNKSYDLYSALAELLNRTED